MNEGSGIPMGQFPPTRWSLVFRAGAADTQCQEALAELVKHYVPALKAHLVYSRWSFRRDELDDLVQGFVTDKIVGARLLSHVTGGRGRFRSFLKKTFDRYVIDEYRRRKRRPSSQSLDPELARQVQGAPEGPDPFDVKWARDVLDEALCRMEAECKAKEREDVWGVFDCQVLAPLRGRASPLPYVELVARFRLKSPLQASNILTTGKRMLRRNLRAVVSDYTQSESETETEIAALEQVLRQGGA